jgi:dihydroflavonol-4-reductase
MGRVLLVTGGTGYLGSVVVALLVDDGHDVRVLARDEERARRVLPAGVEVVIGDLFDEESLAKATAGCTAVLNLAATVGGTPEQIRAANLDGTRLVLAAARAAGARRFVHTSTGAAIMDATGLVAERPVAPPALTDPYSASKAAAEELVLAAEGIEAVVVSPASIYGPSPRGPESYNGLFRAAAAGEVPAVVDAPMAWVLAEDAARGHVLALDRGEAGRRYVLCGEVARVGRVLHAYADAVGGKHVAVLPPGSSLGPDASTFARRSEVYGMFPPVHVDDAGARGLGFAPRGIDEGIALTAAWCGS